jgi:dihydroorotate dehydrogenase
MALIGAGGISSYRDVLSMLAAGAQMVQLYTGLIYEGPGLIKTLNRNLVRFMDEHRCVSLQEAAQLWASEHTDAQAA